MAVSLWPLGKAESTTSVKPMEGMNRHPGRCNLRVIRIATLKCVYGALTLNCCERVSSSVFTLAQAASVSGPIGVAARSFSI